MKCPICNSTKFKVLKSKTSIILRCEICYYFNKKVI